MSLASRAKYLHRVISAYGGSRPSQLTFWHEPPEINERAFEEPCGGYPKWDHKNGSAEDCFHRLA